MQNEIFKGADVYEIGRIIGEAQAWARELETEKPAPIGSCFSIKA